ncbi:hypothetical protein [Dethiobacter alkaliphilus]|uniref:Uncharacterized protein n=1 Tax=Dethiobacter alkaliphilus AHT 1 TaxID=555088 RepID=C0GFG8_DETAL|nr:hypothetical protein [Dethiobacter alkaliphilus]EEG77928.1 hypothetical protein DealDRAFT_1227 [Dethiobacter alkaliphilus AHT 1]
MVNKRESEQKRIWRIRAKTLSHLDCWLVDCFEGLEISHEPGATSTIAGELPDMSAVYGLILLLRDSAISLISLHVEQIERDVG